MDIYEIRLGNLQLLLKERGAAARLGDAVGSGPSYISQLKTGAKRMGDETARRIEEVEGLPRGWMDVAQFELGGVRETRLQNLDRLIDQHGGIAVLAELVDTAPAYLSQIKSEKHPANVGESLARKIEQKLGLRRGWMDLPQSAQAQSDNGAIGDSIKDRLRFALDQLSERSTDGRYGVSWLASQVGISRTAMGKWLSGKVTDMASSNLALAAKALGIELDWLITGKGEMLASPPAAGIPKELDGLVVALVEAWEEGAINANSVAYLEAFLLSLRRH